MQIFKVEVIFLPLPNDLGQRSLFKDKISGEHSHDH